MRKYGNAIRSKPLFLKAITDINENIELQNQIDSDSLTFKNVSLKEVILRSESKSFQPIKTIIKNGMTLKPIV
jgi:hypothetical protein